MTGKLFLYRFQKECVFVKIWIPNWRIIFQFGANISNKSFKQGPNMFRRKSTQDLISTDRSSRMNVMDMLRPFKIIGNKNTEIFNSFDCFNTVRTNLKTVVQRIIRARNMQMLTLSRSKV